MSFIQIALIKSGSTLDVSISSPRACYQPVLLFTSSDQALHDFSRRPYHIVRSRNIPTFTLVIPFAVLIRVEF